jgi:NTP pyrophosphatase (non-canonical NTP hydrolase)
MTTLTFKSLQDYLALKYETRNKSTSDLFIKLVEEIGEVAEILSQLKGNKGVANDIALEKELANELADVIHYVTVLANVNEIDLTKVIIEKDQLASLKYNESPNLETFLNNNEL